MLSRFKRELACFYKDDQDGGIVAAVSGGIDSMTMLTLLQKEGRTPLGVAHCNFQLRGEASYRDESFIRDYCEKHSLPFFCKRFDTHTYAKAKKISIQMAARHMRYAWFEELLCRDGYRYLATAHHFNDHIETLVLNIVRGTGLAGLTGIPIITGKIIRPMMTFGREEIELYAKHHTIPWRQDLSNHENKYHRNKIRHHIVPVLQALNGSLRKTLKRMQKRLLGTRELCDVGLTYLHQKYVVLQDDFVSIDPSMFSLFHHPAAVLWEIIKKYGFHYDQCEGAIKALGKQSEKKFIAGEYQLVMSNSYMKVMPIMKNHMQKESRIYPNDSEVILGNQKLTITYSQKDTFDRTHGQEAVLDTSLLCFPLQWRRWSKGDYFYPLGMTHRKKLSDFFIDKKVPLWEREQATIVVSGDDIVWVVGYRIDHRYRVSNKTMKTVTFLLTT